MVVLIRRRMKMSLSRAALLGLDRLRGSPATWLGFSARPNGEGEHPRSWRPFHSCWWKEKEEDEAEEEEEEI